MFLLSLVVLDEVGFKLLRARIVQVDECDYSRRDDDTREVSGGQQNRQETSNFGVLFCALSTLQRIKIKANLLK